MLYRVTLPYKLDSLNQVISANRSSKYGANNKKASLQQKIWQSFRELERINKPVVIHIHWVEENRRRDLDNIYSAKKFIMDAITDKANKGKERLIPDDSQRWVKDFIETYSIDKGNPRIEIVLEEVDEDYIPRKDDIFC